MIGILTDEDRIKWAAMKRRIRNARRRRLRLEGVRDPRGPVLVYCWMCRRSAWRTVYTIARVVGRKTRVRCYGNCPAHRRWGEGDVDVCEGTMYRMPERVFVLRAALEWDRRGMNNTSEFDR